MKTPLLIALRALLSSKLYAKNPDLVRGTSI
jgi:hypothetical protein